MYLIKQSIEELKLKLGDRLLYVEGDLVKDAIILDPKPNFGYYNKLLTRTLASGIITQSEYDARYNNTNESRTILALNDSTVTNETILELLEDYNLSDLAGDTLIETINNINSQGIQIIL